MLPGLQPPIKLAGYKAFVQQLLEQARAMSNPVATARACDNDGCAPGSLVLVPALSQGHLVGVVADVHQRAHHNLIVHRDLCGGR